MSSTGRCKFEVVELAHLNLQSSVSLFGVVGTERRIAYITFETLGIDV